MALNRQLMLGLLLLMTPDCLYGQEKQIVGWIEKALVFPGHIPFDAKLDTGAATSSINATDIERFSRGDQEWVRFNAVDKSGKKFAFEKKLVGVAEIKRHKGAAQKRFVVKMGLCIGNHYAETDVNLIDRSRFQYPLLVGRSFMAGMLIPDPSLEYTIEPKCQEQ